MSDIVGDDLFSFWTPPRPRDLPEVRRVLAEQMLTEQEAMATAALLAAGKGTLRPRIADPYEAAKVMLWEENQRLSNARMYFVTADMVKLIRRAGDKLPDYRLHPDDVPAQCGFVLFEDTIGDYISEATNPHARVHIVAVSWGPTAMGPVDQSCYWVTFWSATNFPWNVRQLLAGVPGMGRQVAERHIRASKVELGWDNETLIFFTGDGGGVPLDMLRPHPHRDDRTDLTIAAAEATTTPWVQRLRATWLLMTQPKMTETVIEAPNRKARARAERAGYADSSVEVVRLAPRSTRTRSTRTGTGTPWSVRTTVEEHWRNQAWGPGHSRRRPVFIEEHIAGPEGAPLRLKKKERVFLLDNNEPPRRGR